jgi:hypothetical protein
MCRFDILDILPGLDSRTLSQVAGCRPALNVYMGSFDAYGIYLSR